MSVVVTLHNLHVACTRLRAVARASGPISALTVKFFFVFFSRGVYERITVLTPEYSSTRSALSSTASRVGHDPGTY